MVAMVTSISYNPLRSRSQALLPGQFQLPWQQYTEMEEWSTRGRSGGISMWVTSGGSRGWGPTTTGKRVVWSV